VLEKVEGRRATMNENKVMTAEELAEVGDAETVAMALAACTVQRPEEGESDGLSND